MKLNNIELLAPAGDLERARFALEYGADAIYLGARLFSLRARASNFSFEEIQKIVDEAHMKNKKVYLVTNIICHNFILKEFDKFFRQVNELNIDALIVADPFIVYQLRKQFPDLEIHISTQQSITNSYAASFWKRNGATRVVLAREMKYSEIKDLCNNNKNIEIEMFIHGAVCIAFSGRCMMSNNFSLRDANVGGCAQSCRWLYQLGKNTTNYDFTMSAKDMSYLKHLKLLMELPIASFKIEGRMKTVNYLTTVVKTYRELMNQITKNKNSDLKKLESLLAGVANRETDDAFLFDANVTKMLYHEEAKVLRQDFVFVFEKRLKPFTYLISSRNYFDTSMKFEVICPKQPNIEVKILKIWNLQEQLLNIVNTPMTQCIIELNIDQEFDKYHLGKICYE